MRRGELAAALQSASIEARDVLRLSVYVATEEELAAVASELSELLGDVPPAAEVLLQPPVGQARTVVLVWSAEPVPPAKVLRLSAGCSLLEEGDARWLFVQAQPRPGGEAAALVPRDFDETFLALGTRMERCGFGVADLLRTWIYIGGITNQDDVGTERYQRVNEARGRFFSTRAMGRYPASTGIGTAGSRLVLGGIAYRSASRPASHIENAQQTPAFNYPSAVCAVPPLFSRAVSVPDGDRHLILVSGTASIQGSRSVHGDVSSQTSQTLDNIQRVISGVESQAPPLEVLTGVVYVKRRQDAEVVRRLCEERLPGTLLVYVQADVCRPELLVEVEVVALSGQRT